MIVSLFFINSSVIILLWASTCLVCGKTEQKFLGEERAIIVMLLCPALAGMSLKVHQPPFLDDDDNDNDNNNDDDYNDDDDSDSNNNNSS